MTPDQFHQGALEGHPGPTGPIGPQGPIGAPVSQELRNQIMTSVESVRPQYLKKRTRWMKWLP